MPVKFLSEKTSQFSKPTKQYEGHLRKFSNELNSQEQIRKFFIASTADDSQVAVCRKVHQIYQDSLKLQQENTVFGHGDSEAYCKEVLKQHPIPLRSVRKAKENIQCIKLNPSFVVLQPTSKTLSESGNIKRKSEENKMSNEKSSVNSTVLDTYLNGLTLKGYYEKFCSELTPDDC